MRRPTHAAHRSAMFAWVATLFGIGAGSLAAAEPADAGRAGGSSDSAVGRELFTREWIPGDKRSHGGDGLGPVFNDSSCVACHNQGGVGGAGPASKNAQIITAFRNVVPQQHGAARPAQTLPEQIFRSFFGDLDQQPVPTAASPRVPSQPVAPEFVSGVRVSGTVVANPAQLTPQQIEQERKELATLHPGLQSSLSVVLHRSATYDGYDEWRQRFGGMAFSREEKLGEIELFEASVPGSAEKPPRSRGNSVQLIQQIKQDVQMAQQRKVFNQSIQKGNFAIVRSERNTTALFGEGAIDAISDASLEALEKQQAEQGKVSGRVSRLKDGKIGRFGWKAQTPSLEEFVLTACAVELGLNVPGHPQAGAPHKVDYRPAGLDLNADECRALVNFIRELPAPRQRPMADETDVKYVSAGKRLFETVGCAACHVPDVDKAEGVYSDLLLHDLGPELGDSGSSYGVFVPDSTPEGTPAPVPSLTSTQAAGPASQPPKSVVGATRQEWRTPPLWGVRDSGPYLHDGRAETLEQAIAFHGGEAARSAEQFFALSSSERFQVVTFLKSLVAPENIAVGSR